MGLVAPKAPLKPKLVDPPVARLPFQEALVTVTWVPVWV
jgi:hypothetical protein